MLTHRPQANTWSLWHVLQRQELLITIIQAHRSWELKPCKKLCWEHFGGKTGVCEEPRTTVPQQGWGRPNIQMVGSRMYYFLCTDSFIFCLFAHTTVFIFSICVNIYSSLPIACWTEWRTLHSSSLYDCYFSVELFPRNPLPGV